MRQQQAILWFKGVIFLTSLWTILWWYEYPSYELLAEALLESIRRISFWFRGWQGYNFVFLLLYYVSAIF